MYTHLTHMRREFIVSRGYVQCASIFATDLDSDVARSDLTPRKQVSR